MVTLPLNPIDLTKIYKSKLEDKEFTLAVNYAESKEKLSPKQILIYLSNTAFKCGFDTIDDDLLAAYISLNFIVDSPSLDRVVSNIIKVRVGEEVKDSLGLFNIDQINSFIEGNEPLVSELVKTISTLPLFIAERLNRMDESTLVIKGLPDYEEYESNRVGVNILNIFVKGFDAVLAVLSKTGINYSINRNVYNEKSMYQGVDLMKSLFVKGVVHNIIQMFPDSAKENKELLQ